MTRPPDIYALDSETDPFKPGRIPAPFIWGAYCLKKDHYEIFETPWQVASYFENRRAVVYAHNGGKFDYHFLREFINSDESILVIGGRLARFKIGIAEFRDSYNLINVPLSAYKKEKVDYSIFEKEARDIPANQEIIRRYLRADCVYLAEFIDAFIKEYGRGITIAGSSYNYWAAKYQCGNKPQQSASQFERYKPFYFGGRVECFAAGYRERACSVVDINSAYPKAMLENHPIASEAVLLRKLPSAGKVARCLVEFTGVSRGALPFRTPKGELVFPGEGRHRYCVSGWELQTALELNAVDIKTIHAVHYFRESVNFADYIHHFYGLRKIAKLKKDTAADIFAKLFMNSLYGKFAMDPANYEEYLISSVENEQRNKDAGYAPAHKWDDERWLFSRPVPVVKRRYINVATAASVTGYVRAFLYRSLRAVRDPIYCDTDSITAGDVSALETGPELGQWKVELECDAYAIAGKKMYALRSARDQAIDAQTGIAKYPKGAYKVACKGVRLTGEQIVAIARGGEFNYSPEVPTFSVTRQTPVFIDRKIRLTAKIQ